MVFIRARPPTSLSAPSPALPGYNPPAVPLQHFPLHSAIPEPPLTVPRSLREGAHGVRSLRALSPPPSSAPPLTRMTYRRHKVPLSSCSALAMSMRVPSPRGTLSVRRLRHRPPFPHFDACSTRNGQWNGASTPVCSANRRSAPPPPVEFGPSGVRSPCRFRPQLSRCTHCTPAM